MDSVKNLDYEKLLSKTKDVIVLSTVEGLIHWDMETVMPPKAVEQRSQQLALLSRIHHKLATDSEIGKLLNVVQGSVDYKSMGQLEKRNLYLVNKSFREQTVLPETLVSDLARQQAVTINIWKKAKVKKDFSLFKSDLQKLLSLSKQAAELLMPVKEAKTPYDALLDNFEPSMTSETIARTFSELLRGIKPLISKIEKSKQLSTIRINETVSIESQRKITQLITSALGYDTISASAGGRVDETEHPFTTGYYEDVRITTHYYPHNFFNSIFSVLHESGHALYEQNLKQEWEYQPVGSACSYGIHESQSRFYENIIGRSKEFWNSFMPKLREIVPSLSGLEFTSFIQWINRVERSKIRIESDEVTYNLHIIIRFEIERDLFEGNITVDELPEVWNQKYSDYLGVLIEDDSEGVMQDTHWASGLFGYFPSYALGNIYSGQLAAKMTRDLPDWRNSLSVDNIVPVNDWLKANVCSYGALYDPVDLIKLITGSMLDSQPYLKYLNRKYSELYGF